MKNTVFIMLALILFLTGCVNEPILPVKGEVFPEKLAHGERYALGGEWEFYWGEFYTGDDFSKPETVLKKKYIDFKTYWNNAVIDG